MRTEEGRTFRLEDYRPPNWLVRSVELNVVLHETATRVQSLLHLAPNPATGAPAPLVLDGDGLRLVSVKLDGAPLAPEYFVATPQQLSIPQPPSGPFRLEIETQVDPSTNTQLTGLFRSNGTFCTQCEAEGFRRITYFPDRPDVMAIYTTRIEAEKAAAPVLLANGNLVSRGEVLGTNRHFAIWHDPFPKPSYLFALVGGDLACVEDRFVTMSDREVALRIYVEHGKQARCAYAMDSLKRAMRWDEQAFGREYDLDVFMIVAVSDFNMGAMENKGLNIFNDKYVLGSSETATDEDFGRIEAIIAHEYFHNWTGNRITCRDWFQLCLKEGLTVFRDQEFTADQRSRPVKRIADVRTLRAQQFPEDAGPLAHPVRPGAYREINNFYTTTVYEKGAEIVRMLRVLLGPAAFRAGLDLYFTRHDGEAATVENFLQCFADAGDRDLTSFMRWYEQAGTPQVTATGAWDAATRTYRLDLAQKGPPGPMVIPLALGLVAPDGQDFPLTTDAGPVDRGVIVLSERADNFTFRSIPARPVLSLNRGFSAPVRIVSDLSTQDLRFLAAHDSDPFNRWQSVQSLATSLLVANTAAIRADRPLLDDPGLIVALRLILSDDTLEPAFVAQVMTMPSEADIAGEIAQDVDPDAILAARNKLLASIEAVLADLLTATFDRLREAGPYRPDAASAGRRALKNACLGLLAATAAPAAIARAMEQYQAADSMTDRLGALAILATHDVPERTAALDDFYRRFEHDPLVVDKWFALQATIPDLTTLDRVRALTLHPGFSYSNPNRIRALIASFTQSNRTQFNRSDGGGYDFLVDSVLALDARNPQIAARLMGAFNSWQMFEPTRRGHAEAALRRADATPSLSGDVADIVSRALAREPAPVG